jgi:hypothetical protein
VKWMRRIGALVAWVQIAIYGLMAVAFAMGLAWVAYRQSPTGVFALGVCAALVGLLLLVGRYGAK